MQIIEAIRNLLAGERPAGPATPEPKTHAEALEDFRRRRDELARLTAEREAIYRREAPPADTAEVERTIRELVEIEAAIDVAAAALKAAEVRAPILGDVELPMRRQERNAREAEADAAMKAWVAEDDQLRAELARKTAEVEALQRTIYERTVGLNPLANRKNRQAIGVARVLEVDLLKADALVPPDAVLIRPTAWARLVRVGAALRLGRVACKVDERSGLLAEPTGPPELWEAMREFATPECRAKEEKIATQAGR
jgi:hypothetical protein